MYLYSPLGVSVDHNGLQVFTHAQLKRNVSDVVVFEV